MNRALYHFCSHTGKIGPGEPSEDGEMTLPSRHKIRNSNPGGLRPIMGNEHRTLAWKVAVLTTTLEPP